MTNISTLNLNVTLTCQLADTTLEHRVSMSSHSLCLPISYVWEHIHGTAVATACRHLFCVSDAQRIFTNSHTECPMCRTVLNKETDLFSVELGSKKENLLWGQSSTRVLEIAASALEFDRFQVSWRK